MTDYEIERQHDEFYGVASFSDALREFAYNIGDCYPDRCWLLNDYDVWVRNPHYRGPELPHPEDDPDAPINYHLCSAPSGPAPAPAEGGDEVPF